MPKYGEIRRFDSGVYFRFFDAREEAVREAEQDLVMRRVKVATHVRRERVPAPWNNRTEIDQLNRCL